MATFAGRDSLDTVGQKEDISDLIFNISPTETPILSSCDVNDAGQVSHQWQKDTLKTPTGTNAKIEGADASITAGDPTVMVGNFTQISTEDFGVSGTIEVTDKYGRDSELSYQAAKRARDLKNEVDMIIGGINQASALGDGDTVPRTSASLEAWLESNVSRGAGGTSGGSQSPTQVDVAGDGTPRALVQGDLDTVIASGWDNGAKPTLIVTGAHNKGVISTFDGLGNASDSGVTRSDRADRTIYASADTYYSNFGILNVVPSRHIRKLLGTGGTEGTAGQAGRDRNLFCIDPEYLKVAYLRPWQQYDLAKSGDSIKRQMLVEQTLEVCNEAAHGVVADLGGD